MSDDAKPRRRVMTSTQRDLQARVPRVAPGGMVAEIVDDETTGPIPRSPEELPDWATRQSAARRSMGIRLNHACDNIIAHDKRIGSLELFQFDATKAAGGARLARQVRNALFAVAALVPGAALGAGKAFLSARDAAVQAASVAAERQEALRHDIDQLRAEVSALTKLFRSDLP